mgnify:CR=1 FL=1
MKKEFTEIVGGTEIRYVLDEATGTYLPDWELPEQRELGRYGRMRAEFLKENHKGLYQAIVKVDEFSEEGEEPSLHKKSRIFRKLHRLQSTHLLS